MIEGLKPYPEYKESGVPWIGRIPSGWKVVRNGNLFGQRNQTDFGHLPILEVSLRTGVRVRDFSGSARKQVMSDVTKYKRAAKGDIAYNMMRMWQGAVGVAPVDGLVSPAYVVAMPYRETVTQFYGYLFRTQTYLAQVDSYSRGIVKDRNRLYWDDFKQIPSVFPPFDDQTAIVRFLSHASRLIEAYIRAKGKLIALLNEQRQATIHRAVTRGLDHYVRLKPSGVPWLGDIPEHWELRRLRGLIKFGTTITYGIVQAGPDIKDGTPYIRTSDMKGTELPRNGYLRTSPEIDSSYRRSKVEPGDLVVAIRASLGKGMLVPDYLGGANLTQGTARVSPGDRITSEFLGIAFNSKYCQESINMVSKGTTFLEITLESLRRIPLAVPPRNEQEAITLQLERDLQPLLSALSRTEREIALLRQYRTRLIADVVTGQLDVREAARDLADETEDPAGKSDPDDLVEEAELDSEAPGGGDNV